MNFQTLRNFKYIKSVLVVNILENSLNQQMVTTLYCSKGYSIFGELINNLKLSIYFPTHIPRLGIIPFSQ